MDQNVPAGAVDFLDWSLANDEGRTVIPERQKHKLTLEFERLILAGPGIVEQYIDQWYWVWSFLTKAEPISVEFVRAFVDVETVKRERRIRRHSLNNTHRAFISRLIACLEPDLRPLISFSAQKIDPPYQVDLQAVGLDAYIPWGRHGWEVSRIPKEDLGHRVLVQPGAFPNWKTWTHIRKPDPTGTPQLQLDNADTSRVFSQIIEADAKPGETMRVSVVQEHNCHTATVTWTTRRGEIIRHRQRGESPGEAVARLWVNLH
jgi:hypothetical protein